MTWNVRKVQNEFKHHTDKSGSLINQDKLHFRIPGLFKFPVRYTFIRHICTKKPDIRKAYLERA